MKHSVTGKWKLWVIVTVIVVVAGMAVLGFLGINNSVDYSASYEVSVGVDQDIQNSASELKSIADKYFEDKGLKPVDYAFQTFDDGKIFVYKFYGETDLSAEALQKEFTESLSAKSKELESIISDGKLEVSAKVNYVSTVASYDAGWLALALGIAAVAIFAFLWLTEKLASALSAACASAVAALLCTAVGFICRLPVYPFLAVAVAASFALAAILSSGMTNRFKEERKNVGNDKLSEREIADLAARSSKLRFSLTFAVVAVFAIALSVFGLGGYLTFVGLYALIAGASATFASYTFTPMIWAAVKSNKKSK